MPSIKTEEFLEQREGYWQAQLCYEPYGFNAKKEFNSGRRYKISQLMRQFITSEGSPSSLDSTSGYQKGHEVLLSYLGDTHCWFTSGLGGRGISVDIHFSNSSS